MAVDYTIPRDEIAKLFSSPRSRRVFEQALKAVSTSEESAALAVEATTALADASFLTLSANAELTNERVLELGPGLNVTLTATTLALDTSDEVVRADGGHRITLVSGGDANVAVPLSGRLASQEWVTANFAGGGGYTVASVAASYTETATSGEKVVKVTASGQTVTLPTAVGNAAKLTFKLMVAGTLTIDGSGVETIDGAATYGLTAQYETVTLVSDGANWIVI